MRVAVLGSTAGRRYFLLSVSSIAIVVAAVSVLVVPVNALWLRPLSIPSPDGLVIVTATNQDSDGSRFSERGLERLAASNVFAGVAGQVLDRDLFVGLRPQIAFPDGAPVEVLSVTANYFDVVGVPVTGRAFESTDMIEGSPPVAIVSDRFWRTRLGGRPMLGAPLGTRQGPILIVGIASPDFHGALRGENVDLWIPYTLLPRLNRLSAADLVIPFISLCRLPHGASVWGAQAALSAESGRERIVTPVSELFAGGDSPLVRVRERNVMTAVGLTAVLVLLAGCGALMALVLVHHERRQPELAVRAALGATRVHILTLLGRELLMVLACGLGAGLLLLAVVLRWLPRFQLPGGIDFNRLNLAIDWRVVVGAFAAAGLAAIGATALTFLRAASSAGGMHQIASVRGAAPGALKTGSAVVFLHTAVTVTVLIAAVLFVRTVRYGLHSAPGFDASRVLFVSVQTRPFVEVEVADRDERALSDTGAVYRLIETLRQTPSVSAVVVGGPPIGPDRERASERHDR